MERIPLAGPWITQREIDYVSDAVTNAWGAKANMYHDRFEETFAAYVGRKYAIALPSCTSAIHLALLGLNVGPGDEVIVPDSTWIASAAPITYVGATTVFADIDATTWCMRADAFEEAITERTRAVIVVDLYGSMPDMKAIIAIARARGIAVIEDAAQAIGSSYHGGPAGGFGDASVFSFHGSKTLTTGEGGILVTDRDDLLQRALVLRDHGRPTGDVQFHNTEVAYKYKMSSMQAALGLAQIERIDELIDRKRTIFSWYRDAFAHDVDITLNAEPENTRNSYWMVTAVWNLALKQNKTAVLLGMRESGIDSRPFFNALSSLPAFAGSAHAIVAHSRNTVARDVGSRGINLPSAFSLQRDDVTKVHDMLLATLLNHQMSTSAP